jgi:hypothetical protein
MSVNRTNADFVEEMNSLVESWCDRRDLTALRQILQGWPLGSGLTDDLARLASALHSLAGMQHLPEEERRIVKRLWVEADSALRNRH